MMCGSPGMESMSPEDLKYGSYSPKFTDSYRAGKPSKSTLSKPIKLITHTSLLLFPAGMGLGLMPQIKNEHWASALALSGSASSSAAAAAVSSAAMASAAVGYPYHHASAAAYAEHHLGSL